jgi:hypothetical protein
MSAPGFRNGAIKRHRDPEAPMPVDDLRAELDASGDGRCSYHHSEVSRATGEKHGDEALALMQRVCFPTGMHRRERRAVQHTILTNEMRTFALNRRLET